MVTRLILVLGEQLTPDIAALRFQYKARHFKLTAVPGWARQYPQSAWLLEEEALAWQKSDWRLTVDLR